jgi:putative transposase
VPTTLLPSPLPSMVDPGRHSAGRHLVKPLTSTYTQFSKDVLRRPLELKQYASNEYQTLLKDHGLRCSMSRKGDCWDNSVVESFFATLKSELVFHRSWNSRRQAASEIFEYIEVFYNRQRRHSTTNNLSPVDYENRFAPSKRAA